MSTDLMHDILHSFAALPGAVERATIEYQRCPQCGGRGLCIASNMARNELHFEPCRACAAKGYIVTERAP